MSTINNQKDVKEQYASAGNLNTRISIHQKYSTNKMGFGNWIFSNYKITPYYTFKIVFVNKYILSFTKHLQTRILQS